MRAVLFDLDMTLVETRDDIAASVNAVRRQWGLAAIDRPTVDAAIGDGIPALLDRVLGSAIEGREAEALREFSIHYDAHCLDATVAYPGIPEALHVLAERGVPMAVVSNKAERFARKVLDGVGLLNLFGVVVGGDTTPYRKPDPAPLHHALAALKVSDAVMVGDTWRDVRAARAASFPVIAVAWGLDTVDELKRERPDVVITTPSEFLSAIERQLTRPGP